MKKYSFFTPEEIKYILDNGHMYSAEVIAKHLGRSESNVRKVLNKHNIKLLQEYNRSIYTQFKKKKLSWNSGLKINVAPNSGQFKKGHIPANTRKKYSLRVAYDKRNDKHYVYMKLNSKWIFYHRYIWEKINGKIPAGYCLTFKDGNTLNFDLTNLLLVSRGELLRKNRVSYFSKNKLSDTHIASLIVRDNPELRNIVSNCPQLLEIKRMELEVKKILRGIV